VTHVGVFAGEGMLAHASTRGVVRSQLARRYYQRAYWGSRRLLKRSSP
jgi:cell wall-associated NlpC family hydrolase